MNEHYKIIRTESGQTEMFTCPECKGVVTGKSNSDYILTGSQEHTHRSCWIALQKKMTEEHEQWKHQYKLTTMLPGV